MDKYTGEHLAEVERVLDRALDLDTDARREYLELQGEDVRRHVQNLIAQEDQLHPIFADRSRAGVSRVLGTLLSDEASGDLEGASIGSYRIMHCLGRGGMGAVYLARRDDQAFEQFVAFKVVKRGMDTDEIVRRFRQERQILAWLDHEHIAKLIDGGVTPDGRPYFVMEYVPGQAITRYCDTHRVGVTDRITLFLAACRAVSYAHQSLVVHRDLKPSNLLVTDEGQVKLVDFGIAKVLEAASTADTSPATKTGALFLTPEYASPEQVTGRPVTVTTDVYQLGVLLYRLLSGHLPVRLGGKDADSVRRAVLEDEPKPLSVAVLNTDGGDSADTTGPADIARNRATTPTRLERRLAGDLDAIVLQALQKEPARRYRTVPELAEDLERHLAGLPVTARRPTLRYRAAQFVRRHKVGVLATTVIGLLSVGLIVALVTFSLIVRTQSRVVASERDKAEQVSQFMASLFADADPAESRGDTLTVFDVLRRGAERIDEEFEDRPEVKATMLHAMGRVHASVGAQADARSMLESALAIRRDELGDQHGDVAETLTELGLLQNVLGEMDSALTTLNEALAIRRRLYGDRDTLVAAALTNVALAHYGKAAYDSAEVLWRTAASIHRDVHGGDHVDLATVLHNLGSVASYVRGAPEEAVPLFREALEVRRRVFGPPHPRIALTMTSLADALRMAGDIGDAEELHLASLDMNRQLYPSDHPAVAGGLNNVAVFYMYTDRFADAVRPLREARAIYRTVYGETHALVGTVTDNLASAMRLAGDTVGAIALGEEALHLRRQALGNRHPDVSNSLNNLALTLRDTGDLVKAERYFREALAIREATLAPSNPDLENTNRNLGITLRMAERTSEAVPFLSRAVAIARQAFAEDDVRRAAPMITLGIALIETEDYEDAVRVLTETVDVRQRALGDEAYLTASARSRLGEAFTGTGRYDEAEVLLLESHRVIERERGSDSPTTAASVRRLITLYEVWDRPADAARFRTMLPP